MFIMSHQPADPTIHEVSIKVARRCRGIVQACLREEEWSEADRQFYLVIREELERLSAGQGGRESGRGRPRP